MTEVSIETTPAAVAPAPLQAGRLYGNRQYGREFIGLAALGDNSRRAYLIALLRIVLYPVGFGFAAGVGIAMAYGILMATDQKPPTELDPIVRFIVQFGAIVAVGVAVIQTVARTHRRPWLSLISPDLRLDSRRLAIGAGVELGLMLVSLFLVSAVTGLPWHWPSGAQLPMLLLILLLVPLQAASEEILFRGYLTQALGRITRSRCLIAAVVAALFGLAHLGTYGPVTMPYFFVLSLLYSLVSLRDGRLELTIGAHAGMNLCALGVATLVVGDPATGGTDHVGHAAVILGWTAPLVLVLRGALFYGLTRLLVGFFCDRRAAA